jgi:hypothetical protein
LTAGLAIAAAQVSLTPSDTVMAAGREISRVRPSGWGPRAGFSSVPGQFVVGLHYDAGEFARRLRFVPNIDLGVGDHSTVLTINPDLVYSFPVDGTGCVYTGGSVGVVWRDRGGSLGPGGAEGQGRTEHTSEVDLGVAGIFGYRSQWSGRTVFLDTKIRISGAYPGVKLMVGTEFGE